MKKGLPLSAIHHGGNFSQKHSFPWKNSSFIFFMKLGHIFTPKPIQWQESNGVTMVGLYCRGTIFSEPTAAYPEQNQGSVSKVAGEHGCWIVNNQQCLSRGHRDWYLAVDFYLIQPNTKSTFPLN